MTAVLTAVGFLIGMLVGFELRDAAELIRSRKDSPMPLSTPAHRVMTMGLILSIVLVSIVGAGLIVTRKSANDYFTCIADWQQRFGQVYRARAGAMDKIVHAVAAKDELAIYRAVAEYEEAPMIPLPEKVCGKASEVRR